MSSTPDLVMWEGSVGAHDYLGQLTATAPPQPSPPRPAPPELTTRDDLGMVLT